MKMRIEKMKALGISSISEVTNARMNFDFAMVDVKALLSLHDKQSGSKTGKPGRGLEVFKRAGIILTVTAWEAFIEDTSTILFEWRLKNIASPNDLPDILSSIVDSHVSKMKGESENISASRIRKQILEDDWKELFLEKQKKDVSDLNTPNGKNIRKLYVRYLGKDVTEYWRWSHMTSQRVCEKLDQLIWLRGSLVHRGKEVFEERTGATRANLVNAISLVERLAACTEKALEVEPKVIRV